MTKKIYCQILQCCEKNEIKFTKFKYFIVMFRFSNGISPNLYQFRTRQNSTVCFKKKKNRSTHSRLQLIMIVLKWICVLATVFHWYCFFLCYCSFVLFYDTQFISCIVLLVVRASAFASQLSAQREFAHSRNGKSTSVIIICCCLFILALNRLLNHIIKADIRPAKPAKHTDGNDNGLISLSTQNC